MSVTSNPFFYRRLSVDNIVFSCFANMYVPINVIVACRVRFVTNRDCLSLIKIATLVSIVHVPVSNFYDVC